MKCPNCQTENPEDSKYCKECASPLTLREEFGATVTLKPSEAGLLKGTVIAGKYRIDKMIGRGGMGIIYQAQDTKLKRPVALKFLSSELMHSQEARERFVREAQAAFVEKDARAALVTSTDDYGYSDPYHYDTAGYIDLGRQFADALHELEASTAAP